MGAGDQQPLLLHCTVYRLREGGKKLSIEQVRATARVGWVWRGVDGARGPVAIARLAMDSRSAADCSIAPLDLLDDARIQVMEERGVLLSGSDWDLSRHVPVSERRQAWWCERIHA